MRGRRVTNANGTQTPLQRDSDDACELNAIQIDVALVTQQITIYERHDDEVTDDERKCRLGKARMKVIRPHP